MKCEDCKHWDSEKAPWEAVGCGHCKILSSNDGGYRDALNKNKDDVDFDLSNKFLETRKAIAIDSSAYSSTFYTRPDFSCCNWEEK